MNSGSSPKIQQYEEITNNLLISNHIYYDNKCSAPAPSQ